MIEVTDAKHIGGYRLEVQLNDGTSGTIDFDELLWGPVFAPLRDLAVFKQFHVSRDFGTLVWANGADVAPEWLHARLKKTQTLSKVAEQQAHYG